MCKRVGSNNCAPCEGGTRIAAPPSGATKEAVHLLRAAERYRALLEIGDKIGVTLQVELWGFSRSLNRLGESVERVTQSGYESKSKDLKNVIWVSLGKLATVDRVPGEGYRLKKRKVSSSKQKG